MGHFHLVVRVRTVIAKASQVNADAGRTTLNIFAIMRTIKTAFVGAVAAAAVFAAAGVASGADASPIDLARQLNEAFIQVADQASASVVVIRITGKSTENDGDESGSFLDSLPPEWRQYFEEHSGRGRSRPHKVYGEGSGIIVTADGYILTNNHVVENADKIEVRFKDGREFEGEVKGTDPESDVAVVKIKATGLTPAKLATRTPRALGNLSWPSALRLR